VRAGLAQPLDHVQRLHTLRHVQGGLRQPDQIQRLVADVAGKQILHHHHPDHIVQVVAGHRVARMAVHQHRLADFGERVRHVEPDNVAPRGHDHADRAIAQAEDLLHDLFFDRLEDAALRALLDQHPHFFFGDHRLVEQFDAHQPQRPFAGTGEQPDQGRREPRQGGHGPRNPAADALGVVQRQSLRDEFTDHQREIGHDDYDDKDRQRLRDVGGHGELGQQRGKPGQTA
jgi:hypothetical protein